MPKSPTAIYHPKTLPEALQLLAQPDTLPLSGGTKLLAGDVASAVVDLQYLGLNQITQTEERLNIGATLPLSEVFSALEGHAEKSTPAGLLRQAIHQAGPNTYRNAATLGGTIASRLPDSELLAALLVLEATIALHTPELLEVNIADYLRAEARPFGLITAITIPWQAGRFASERVARTPRDYPIVSITLWQPQNKPPRLAATGLAERPFRLTSAEKHLRQGMTPAAIDQAATAASEATTHPGDFRGDAAYRAQMAAVLTRRVAFGA